MRYHLHYVRLYVNAAFIRAFHNLLAVRKMGQNFGVSYRQLLAFGTNEVNLTKKLFVLSRKFLSYKLVLVSFVRANLMLSTLSTDKAFASFALNWIIGDSLTASADNLRLQSLFNRP